jgi:hypothetical protein
VLFDEFEKVYDRDNQEKILTLLDGVYPSKKLFVLTCNDKYRVDHHMRNRPGRIFYMIEFKGLVGEFITEYCEDNLTNKEHIPQICRLSTLFSEFNFDMLKALVEEMNRYGETPQEAMQLLNAKPELDGDNKFEVQIESNGITISNSSYLSPSTWAGNPLARPITIEYDLEPTNDDACWIEGVFTQADLREIDSETGSFVFVNARKEKLLLKRKRQTNFNYFNAL